METIFVLNMWIMESDGDALRRLYNFAVMFKTGVLYFGIAQNLIHKIIHLIQLNSKNQFFHFNLSQKKIKIIKIQ